MLHFIVAQLIFKQQQEPFGTNTVAICLYKQKLFKFVFAADYTLQKK